MYFTKARALERIPHPCQGTGKVCVCVEALTLFSSQPPASPEQLLHSPTARVSLAPFLVPPQQPQPALRSPAPGHAPSPGSLEAGWLGIAPAPATPGSAPCCAARGTASPGTGPRGAVGPHGGPPPPGSGTGGRGVGKIRGWEARPGVQGSLPVGSSFSWAPHFPSEPRLGDTGLWA